MNDVTFSEPVIVHLPGKGDRKVDQLRSDRMHSERMAAMGERQELAQLVVGLPRCPRWWVCR
ncbi:hypothetical protein PZ895_05110 [Mesorhizobium sp. YIM 152430]|uniref:hypothetical protein n=1 Tax=Mesorhizobium sp. YIM 152430 TaxID=3031761 RepID=UPI0023DC15A3|nr:hypothetical protein [Mesorhizobium sp. YIM 152430]MDF1599158.1 hypothetical protein [Mesorhizobium sp. YIM 152430]